MLKHSTSKRLTEFNYDKYPQQIMIYQYLGSMINDTRCTCEIKSRVAMSKATFQKKMKEEEEDEEE